MSFLLGRFEYKKEEEFDTFLSDNQKKYIDSSLFFKKVFKSWTSNSPPLYVLNEYLRNNDKNKHIEALIYFGSNLIINEFINQFNNFILSAPRFSRDILLHRGTANIKPYSVIENQFVVTGISGYTYFKDTAMQLNYLKFSEFEVDKNQCCLYELLLPSNSPFLFLGNISGSPSENEFMLPISSVFQYTGKRVEKGVIIISGTYIGFVNEPTKNLPQEACFYQEQAMKLSNDLSIRRVTSLTKPHLTKQLYLEEASRYELYNQYSQTLNLNNLNYNIIFRLWPSDFYDFDYKEHYSWFFEFVDNLRTFEITCKKKKSLKKPRIKLVSKSKKSKKKSNKSNIKN
jgi:hypothetical protein